MNIKKICVTSVMLSLILSAIGGSYTFSLWVAERAQAQLIDEKNDLRDDIKRVEEKTDKIYDLILEMKTNQ